MLVLVSYDVETLDKIGQRRLRKIAKICTNYGQRVQYSVFECLVDPAQWVVLKQELINTVDLQKDSLRFYFLGANWKRRVEHLGSKGVPDLEEGTLIV